MYASLKLPLQGHSWMHLLLARPMAARERHLHQLHLPLLSGEYVISKLCLFFLLLIHGAFLLLTPHVYSFISLLFKKKNLFIYLFIIIIIIIIIYNLSIRRTLLPPAPYYLMSPSWRYIPSLRMHFHCHMLLCIFSPFLFLHVYLFLLSTLTSTFFLSLLPFFLG